MIFHKINDISNIYYHNYKNNFLELILCFALNNNELYLIGLKLVHSQTHTLKNNTIWLQNSNLFIKQDFAKQIKKYIDYLDKYFIGQSPIFDLNIGIYNPTDFQFLVWQSLSNIPYGKFISYSQIAQNINIPKAIRAVGTAVSQNPIAIILPCHRVLPKNSKLFKHNFPITELDVGQFMYGAKIKSLFLNLEIGNR